MKADAACIGSSCSAALSVLLLVVAHLAGVTDATMCQLINSGFCVQLLTYCVSTLTTPCNMLSAVS